MKRVTFYLLIICGIALSGCDRGGAQNKVTAPSAVAEDSESNRFTVAVVGDGPDIILIPGLASHPDVFASTVEQLKDRYTLHLIHISGFAGAPVAGNEGQNDILRPVGEEIARYAIGLDGEPVIIGHSLGGLAALIAGINAPGSIEKIMIIDVLPFFSLLIDPDATAMSMGPMANYLKATLLSQTDQVFEKQQREAIKALTKSDEAVRMSIDWSLTTNRAVMAEAMHDVLTTDLRGDLSSLEFPITVIYGQDSAIPNLERVEAQFKSTYDVAPNSKTIPIPDALHFIMYDQPEAYARELESFLASE